jgi:hypothetical protein
MVLARNILKWLFRWAGKRALVGRYVDRQHPHQGRFTVTDLNRILNGMLHHFETLLPKANIGRFKTLGSRINVLLSVASLAMYRALLEEEIERDYAIELFTGVAWKVYEKFVVVPRLLARLTTRDPQERMNFMLLAFLRFPFNRPGYQWKVKSQEEGLQGQALQIDFYRCPVRDYFHEMGEEDFLLNSWCTLDFALAQAMVKGGHYERPHTLSAGDPLCDMTWSA